MTKKESIEKLAQYNDLSEVTILTKDFKGNPYLATIERISWSETPNDEIEIILVPCD